MVSKLNPCKLKISVAKKISGSAGRAQPKISLTVPFFFVVIMVYLVKPLKNFECDKSINSSIRFRELIND